MIDPVTTTLAYDRQHELLQQAEADRLLHGARVDDDQPRRQWLGIPDFFGRLFAAGPAKELPNVDEPAEDDAPTAA
jgi:hypothetical protein